MKRRPLSDDLTAAFRSVYKRNKKTAVIPRLNGRVFVRYIEGIKTTAVIPRLNGRVSFGIEKEEKKWPLSHDLTAAFRLRTRCAAALELRPIFQSIENTV